ncbi:MAG: transposase [Lewinellaceae bacterium]|nr:transposase [Lewinellaceae bacterium]
MKRDVQLIKKRRRYTPGFKQQLVSEYESGRFSVPQLSRLYGIRCQNIYNWIYKYSIFNEKGYRVVEEKQSSGQKMQQLEQRIAQLEAALGRKQIELDFLEKLLEIAKEDLQIDIKKNYSNRPCGGLGKTTDK